MTNSSDLLRGTRWLLLMIAIAGCSEPAKTPAAPQPPDRNMLLIYVEDMGVDLTVDMGQVDVSPIQTPNLDGLAKRGVHFRNAYSPVPLCNPARLATLFGLRPSTTGAFLNRHSFRENTWFDVPCLPLKFKQEGFRTLGTGKIFHKGFVDRSIWDQYQRFRSDEGVEQPEDPREGGRRYVFYGPYENGPDGSLAQTADTKQTNACIEMMKSADGPFFLAVGYHAPHSPYVYPERFGNLYDPDRDVPPLPDAEASEWKTQVPEAAWECILDLDPKITDREKGRREATVAYWRTMTSIDEEVGRLLDAVEELGLTEKTAVVFLSDHGFSNGHHDRWGKDKLYEWSARTWFTVSVPWMEAAHGQVCNRPIDHVDLYPTLMDLFGLSAPAALEGDSLRPLLEDPQAPFKPAIAMTEPDPGTEAYMVRKDRYKLIYWETGTHQLYDLVEDAGEYRNLSADPQYESVIAEHVQMLRDEGVLSEDAGP